jgi:signal transduction histidine kinase
VRGRRHLDPLVEPVPAIVETQAIVNAADLPVAEVMQLVVERTRAVTGASGAVIELAEGDEMVYRAATGSAVAAVGLRLRREGSLSGLCVSTGRVLRCEDSENDPRVDREACRRVGARSMVVAPLVHRGTTMGVLKVLSAEPGAFDAGDVGNLQLMAGFVAASLSHARRFDDNAARIHDLSLLNAALDEFSAHVAHDLHNPLAVVAMAAAGLRKVLGEADPRASELVDAIEGEAARSSELIDGLLALARASRTPYREPFDLGDVVAEAARVVGDVRVENRCRDQKVVADRLAVRQALANLLSNGARHGVGEDGSAVLTVDCEETLDGWRVLVADRGPGLAQDDLDRVFAAFERGRGAAPAEGNGLGLAIVAAMAAAHGGQVGYEPRPGGGAVFWFSLLSED